MTYNHTEAIDAIKRVFEDTVNYPTHHDVCREIAKILDNTKP